MAVRALLWLLKELTGFALAIGACAAAIDRGVPSWAAGLMAGTALAVLEASTRYYYRRGEP